MKKHAEITPERLFEAAEAVLKVLADAAQPTTPQELITSLSSKFSPTELEEAAMFLVRMGYLAMPRREEA